VELLVVIGIIATLIALLLPALARAREQAQLVTCASQMRQLAFAWMNYATDNAGHLPSGGTESAIDWINRSESTPIESGALFRYTRQPRVYKCPADPREEYLWSYAIIQPASGPQRAGVWKKLVQIRSPDRAAVFLEDNDNRGAVLGTWIMQAPEPPADEQQPVVEPAFIDMLAPWHRTGRNGGTNIAYADGHVDPYFWRDRRTTAHIVQEGNAPSAAQPDNPDLQFLAGIYSPRR
jgi:prepilin-type processing-associated H-X9-DG protein